VGKDEGELRLAWVLLNLHGDAPNGCRVPLEHPYSVPLPCAGLYRVLWRDKESGLSRSKCFKAPIAAWVEARWLESLGHGDVTVRARG
jgi:hypothetical protein